MSETIMRTIVLMMLAYTIGHMVGEVKRIREYQRNISLVDTGQAMWALIDGQWEIRYTVKEK